MNKSVYIHIPFCTNICNYCDFCKRYYEEELCNKYLDSLEKEIKEKYQNEIIDTLYIGGGTPSSLSTKMLIKLMNIIKIFKLNNNYEFTIEVNPENIDEEKLKILKENKVNRISMGIESTINKNLVYLGRHHNYELCKEKINIIKKYFNNINVDLIYAYKNQTLEELEQDIDNILKLDINHISTYSLIINPNTIFYINKEKNIDEDLDSDMYELIKNKLKANNFTHYEISNFAKNNSYSRHNLTYWNNKEYYGFGLGSSGYINKERYDNTKDINKYLNGIYVYNIEKLNQDDIIKYEIILGFRKIEGINKKEFYDKYNINLIDYKNIRDLINKGYLEENNEYIKIKEEYIYVENIILTNFI